MEHDVLEQMVLSGAMFGDREPPSPTRSDHRSRSPSPEHNIFDTSGNSDEEEYYEGTHITATSRLREEQAARDREGTHESIGMGPGRTGVKGVIRDRNEAKEREAEKLKQERTQLADRMKKMDLSAKTYLEEVDAEDKTKEQREGDAWQGIEGWRRKRMMELKGGLQSSESSAAAGGPLYGHLREVGMNGFVGAVESVPKQVWVILHIYDSSLSRCAVLDAQLVHLARRYPSAKFLRAKASAIGFTTNGSNSQGSGRTGGLPRPGVSSLSSRRYAEHDDLADDSDEEQPGSFRIEPEPDYDVLPTMLVYRAGELEFNWPRVDVDLKNSGGGVEGLEALLSRHRIIQPYNVASQPHAGSLSDEEELEFAQDVEW
ncbi:hypothetical protein FRC02_003722 [Tulasnella sp. 418]|nr:hypothetical protein FRC02_003722 [Tulasnella sp. 418]